MPIIDFTIDGRCSNCGACCTEFIPLTEKEIKSIKQYIKDNNIKPYPLEGPDGIYCICPFRDRTNKCCQIYEVRPEICRSFLCRRLEKRLMNEKEKIMKKADYNTEKGNYISLRAIFYADYRLDNIMKLN